MDSTTIASPLTLTQDDLELIKQCAKKQSFSKDDVIFSEGDEADSMYFIERGVLSVVIQKFTRQEMVASMRPGDCVGEMAFINGDKRAATVIAQTDCDLLAVSRDDFKSMLSQHGELASRVKQIVESRSLGLADKESLINCVDSDGKFHLGIKGDPSLRESAFLRERYKSVVDDILPQLQPALYELLLNRCVYEVLIHFNSGEVVVKSIYNPFMDDIHPASKLISKAYINRHFPKVDYDEKLDMAKRMMEYLAREPSLEDMDNILRERLATTYNSWEPLKPKELANTISRLMSLRRIPDFYLRNFTISTIRDSIRLQFNCDGTHLLDSETYQVFLKNNLLEDEEGFEIDRRKTYRRSEVVCHTAYLKASSSDRRSPPGRRKEDWDALHKALT